MLMCELPVSNLVQSADKSVSSRAFLFYIEKKIGHWRILRARTQKIFPLNREENLFLAQMQ